MFRSYYSYIHQSYQASSAICNWRSAIGEHALLRLTNIFTTEQFKNSKSLRKDYVEGGLNGLAYIYRDPQTKVNVLIW